MGDGKGHAAECPPVTLDAWPVAVAAGVLGWCVGWLSAWLTEWLEADARPPFSVFVRDPLVQTGSALVWAALGARGDWLRALEGGLIATPLIQVAVTDLKTRYVYTAVAAVGIAIGL